LDVESGWKSRWGRAGDRQDKTYGKSVQKEAPKYYTEDTEQSKVSHGSRTLKGRTV
jgi:hypothetical protein